MTGIGPLEPDFLRIVDSIPYHLWVSGTDGHTELINARASALAGGAPADLGWHGIALVHPDDRPRVRSELEDGVRLGEPCTLSCRVVGSDGSFRWHQLSLVPVRDDSGEVAHWVGTAVDIDDASKEARLVLERQVLETEARLETLESNVPLGVGFFDRNYRIIRANATLTAISGQTVAESVGLTVSAVVPYVWAQVEPLYRRVLDQGESVRDFEIVGPTPAAEGSRTRTSSFFPVVVEGEIIGMLALAADVTERRAAAGVRRQLVAFVDGSADAIYGVARDGTVTSWNGAAERLFGYTAGEVVGGPVSVIAPARLLDEQTSTRELLYAGGPPTHFETVRRRKDGSEVEVLIALSRATNHEGEVIGMSTIAHDITEQRHERRALETSSRQLEEAQRIAHLGSFEFDLLTGVLTWSREYSRILDVDPAQTPTAELFMTKVHPADVAAVGKAWSRAITRGLAFDLEFRIIRGGSEVRWTRARGIADVADDGTVVKLVGTMLDDTERVLAEREHEFAAARFEVGFEQSAVGAVIADLDGVPRRVNPAMCALLGRPEEQLLGKLWTDYRPAGEVPPGTSVPGVAGMPIGQDTQVDERCYVRPDGSTVWALCDTTLVRDEDGVPQYFYVQMQDITGHKRLELDLAHNALHDTLTGLPNRALLVDRLVHGLAGAQRRSTSLGVMFLDIDQFKSINDVLGHPIGDDLLKHAARRIVAAIRPGDTVARFDRDEFVIVCDDVSLVEVEQIAARVVETFSQPFHIDTEDISVTVSVGIAIADDAAKPETLLRNSQLAMTRAKQRGPGHTELFDELLRTTAHRRQTVHAALDGALERREFTVHYQPVVDLSTGMMVSVEALLRWNHPERGLISPVEVIPLAEETGLIVTIGAWLLEEACKALIEWQDIQRRSNPAGAAFTVAVNMSVRQMQAPDIAGMVDRVLQRTGVRPADLCLELTESVFMDDVDYYERTLRSLKALGLHLAIDDFGTGFSSLSYLKRFPIDAVKIDKSFVDGLGIDAHDTALVAAIVAMAAALDLDLTVEGVETVLQVAELKKLHVRRVQGFLLAKSMPADDISRLLAESHRWPID